MGLFGCEVGCEIGCEIGCEVVSKFGCEVGQECEIWLQVATVHAREGEVSYSTVFSELALFHSKAKAKTALTRLE